MTPNTNMLNSKPPIQLSTSIIEGNIWHRRLNPKNHSFHSKTFYLLADLDDLQPGGTACSLMTPGPKLFSVKNPDYVQKDNRTILEKIQSFLKASGSPSPASKIYLLTSPRFLGLGFNPANLYLCLDANQCLESAVLEINNTFGEKHMYYLATLQAIASTSSSWRWKQKKEFFVSPFNKVEGDYVIDLNLTNQGLKLNIAIEKENKIFFSAGIQGQPLPFSSLQLFRSFLRMPGSIVLTTWRIGFQAFILFIFKNMVFHPKPDPISAKTLRENKPVLLQRLLTPPWLEKFYYRLQKSY